MKVLILELDGSGHRFTWVRLIVEALRRLPVSVVVGTLEGRDRLEEFLHQIEPVCRSDEMCFLPPVRSTGPAGLLDRICVLRTAIRRTSAEHVLIPWFDRLALRAGPLSMLGLDKLRRGVELETLLSRGALAYPARGLVQMCRNWCSFTLAMMLRTERTHFLDPVVYDLARNRFHGSSGRFRLMPDPIEAMPELSRAEARSALGLNPSGRYISCSGSLDERKGVDRLIRAFLDGGLGDDVRLLLGGRLSRPVAALLAEEAQRGADLGRVVVMDRYLSDEELACVNFASDVVATVYPRHIGSASIVIRAAHARRPVLGADFGWIGRTIADFGLGWTCDVDSPQAIANGLREALAGADQWALGDIGRAFVRYHTVENFQAHWTARLRERLGMPQAERLPWPGQKVL